jgi:hypothetical protein
VENFRFFPYEGTAALDSKQSQTGKPSRNRFSLRFSACERWKPPRETDAPAPIRERTARKSVLCTVLCTVLWTVLWTVLYLARTQLPSRQTKCEKKTPRKCARASTSIGRERPPVLGRAAAPALRASGVAPALRRIHTNAVRDVLPTSPTGE